MKSCIFVGDLALKKAQFGQMFGSLFQVKSFWPPGLDLASSLICRSVGFMKVWSTINGVISLSAGYFSPGRSYCRVPKFCMGL